MRSLLIIVALCVFGASVFAQQAAKPKLVGTWRPGFEDYGEFIYHRVEAFAFVYLKENPNAKMIARLCSQDKLPAALAASPGAPYVLPDQAKTLRAPADRMFIARWSKCQAKTEQYWFVPTNGHIEFDEMLPAERVRVNRLLVGYYANPNSEAVKREFAKKLNEFVAELKNDPKTEGFIIRNNGISNRQLEAALQQLRKEQITRYQIVRKREYSSYYPEFMTVTIAE
jgi:hypothetical protein